MAVDALQLERIVKDVVTRIVSSKLPRPEAVLCPVDTARAPETGAARTPRLDRVPGERGAGLFGSVDDAVKAAKLAQRELIRLRLEKREQLLDAMRHVAVEHAAELAEMAVQESGMGRIEDKALKNRMAALKTPGSEILQPSAITGDRGLTLIEHAPYGVIGSITPVTNPIATVINNSISIVAAGNAVVFSVHPGAKESSLRTIQLLSRAVTEAGGPANLIASIDEPSQERTRELMSHPGINVLVVTGGPAIVRMALSSGKKVIGAGAGNPPVLVDETADLERAAKSIVAGASFDNNLQCIAEKEVIAIDYIANQLISYMRQNGAYLATGAQVQALMDLVLTRDEKARAEDCTVRPLRPYIGVNKNYIGKDAAYIMSKAGVKIPQETKLIICEVDRDHPFVFEELMMPILPIVRVADIDEAIELGVRVEHGNRHTALMHSQNIDNLTRFARAVETTLFVKNGPSYAGIGIGGEGYITFTIAGPTGEGLTTARSFTRMRHCVLVDGFSIVCGG